jgi:AcrR family transcriptional regulator
MAKSRKSAKKATAAPAMPAAKAPGGRVIEAALALAAERGWRQVAAAAKLSLAELYALYPSKAAILAAFVRRIDGEVLGEGEAEGDNPRDRLFDVVMRRFEALKPHRAGIEAILHDAGRDPLALLCGGPRLLRSMAWMLEAAGLPSHGLGGRLRAKGLAVVYLATMRVWLSDESEDLSRTMAALDKHLRRAEGLAGMCPPALRRGRQGEAGQAA